MVAERTTDVARAAKLLQTGGLVAFATETVYGLGANALLPEAVARIFEAKGRPHFDPLIVHLADAAELTRHVADVPPVARQLADRFWPGPLTLVLPKQDHIPDLVTSGLPSVAVRIPAHAMARELIRLAGCPVAAPSANLFGRISPTTADHVLDQLADRIDLVLEGGPCSVGVESTIVDVTGEVPVLLRPGGVPLEAIEALVGEVRRPAWGGSAAAEGAFGPQLAPGMLPQHYAPRRPVRLVTDWADVPAAPDSAALVLQGVPKPERFGRVEVLSASGDLREAATRFFAALRRLDDESVSVIWAELFPARDLGLALNDRLRRAAAAAVSGQFPDGTSSL